MNIIVSVGTLERQKEFQNPTESDVFEFIGSILCDNNLKIPNHLTVQANGIKMAGFDLKVRGSYIENGIKKPSLYVVEDYNFFKLPPSTYKEAYLTCIHPESNNYKFYHLKPTCSGINATYGRIGAEDGEFYAPKSLQTPYPTYMYWIRYYEKLSKGYVDQSHIYLNKSEKKKACKTKVSEDSYKVSELSKELFNELKSCARQYVQEQVINDNITYSQYKMSKKYLNELRNRKTLKGFNDKLKQLLSVCPRKARYVSTFFATSVCDFPKIISREESLVNAMEALVTEGKSNKTISNCFEVLGIKVYEATDKQKEEVIRHLDAGLDKKIDTIYRIIHKKHKQRFDKYLEDNKIKKVKQFWHGSRTENWFSIILNGLLISPDCAIKTGSMFGAGIYFAPSSNKSWKYTSYHNSYYAHGSSNVAYMGLFATAYGTPEDTYIACKYNKNYLNQRGKNCVHAHAGSALYNDEIVFYDESATCLNYIVKFKD